MKKNFYRTGLIFGTIFTLYLLVVITMINSKDSNLTAFAMISALVPLISGVGSLVWLLNFISRVINKEISFKNYILPFILTSIATLIVVYCFFRMRIFV